LAIRELQIERAEHLRFARERGDKDTFVGRDEPRGPLQRIREYLADESRFPLVVHGESGCGKSALLARALLEIPEPMKPVARFLGVTPRSSDLRSLLTSLCLELRQAHSLPTQFPTEIYDLIQELRDHLAVQPVILFLDALDQLSETDSAPMLRWLPGSESDPLPRHAKIVVSCLSDRDQNDPAGQAYAALQRRRLPTENMVNLDPLSVDDAKTLIFEHWLKGAARTVDNKEKNQAGKTQREVIEERLHSDKHCCYPLFLKLLSEEVRLWRSYDKLFRLYEPEIATTNEASKDSTKPGSYPHLAALLRQLFDRLREDPNHGPLLVDRAVGYLAAARYGLSESEILEVLFADKVDDAGNPGYKTYLDAESERTNHALPTDPPRIPIAIWSRLRSDLTPYLTERAAPGGNVWTFFQRQVAEWVTARFVNEARWMPHPRLAKFFNDRSDAHALTELPWQFAKGNQQSELHALLTNLTYLHDRCRLDDVRLLIDDYSLSLETADGPLHLWPEFLTKHTDSLLQFDELLFSLVHHEGFESARNQAKSLAEKGWSRPWIRLTSFSKRGVAIEDSDEHLVTRAEFLSNHEYGFAGAGSVSPEHALAFVAAGLPDTASVIDLRRGRSWPVTLPVGTQPILAMSITRNAHILAVTFADGCLALYRIHRHANSQCIAQDYAQFQFKTTKSDAPMIGFVDEDLIYQSPDGGASALSVNSAILAPRVLVPYNKISRQAELSGITRCGEGTLLAFRADERTAHIIVVAGSSVLHLDTQLPPLTAITQLVDGGSAVAFADKSLRVFDISHDGLNIRIRYELKLKESVLAMTSLRDRLYWLDRCGRIGWSRVREPFPHFIQAERPLPRALELVAIDHTTLAFLTHSNAGLVCLDQQRVSLRPRWKLYL
jgi:hypothetical protein